MSRSKVAEFLLYLAIVALALVLWAWWTPYYARFLETMAQR